MFENDEEFEKRKFADIRQMAGDAEFQNLSSAWFRNSFKHRYSYNFRWMGLPIIQYPADIIAMQELIFTVRPSRIVETGIARGGSMAFYASMLNMIGIDGLVVGVEISLSDENRRLLDEHPMSKFMKVVDGSSVDQENVDKVRCHLGEQSPVLVVLDSHHGHEHVLEELRLYSPFVQKNSYIVVFDTVVEDLPGSMSEDRPWGPGNNPKTAVHAFIEENPRFEIDTTFNDKLLLSVAPDGFLRCVANS